MKKLYVMNGKEYDTMAAIARDLKVRRVYPKDFDKYGITLKEDDTAPEISPEAAQAATDTSEPKTAKPKTEKKSNAKPTEDTTSKAEDKKQETKSEPKKTATKKDTTPTTPLAPASDALRAYAKELKEMTLDDLIKAAKAAKIDTFDGVDNAAIKRMRLTMALKAAKFPNEKLSSVSYSGFRKIPLTDLQAYADNNGIQYRAIPTNEGIQRMWLTSALTAAGVDPATIPVGGETAAS